LLRQAARNGGALLAVVHDLTLAARFADRVLVMDKGRIVADAPPGEALSAARIASVFGVETTAVDIGGAIVPVASRAI
jgi:iron complex transport system ATP-binding protein